MKRSAAASLCVVAPTLLLALSAMLAIAQPAPGTEPPAVGRAQPRLTTLATNIGSAGLLDSGELLCLNFDGEFSLLDLDSGETRPWAPAWDPLSDGWESTSGNGFNWKLAVSPDGRHVALATTVWVTQHDPDGDYPASAVAVLLSGPDGVGARCVALADVTDGGPQLDFTQDSARLVGPWYFACQPTAEGFKHFVASGYSDPALPQIDFIATATGRGGSAGLPDYEFYLKPPDSDNFVFEALDDPGLTFASFNGGSSGSFSPPAGQYLLYYAWAAPDALLVSLDDGSQLVVHPDGSSHAAPRARWLCFTHLPDGSCLFSDDGGQSVQHGCVDWDSFSVSAATPCPDLARFAGPLGDDGWPTRLSQWIPLPDSSGVVVITPEEGELTLIKF